MTLADPNLLGDYLDNTAYPALLLLPPVRGHRPQVPVKAEHDGCQLALAVNEPQLFNRCGRPDGRG